ncbi:uncharacterized protein LOC130804265 isoform X2 [Amaranthus tricolor]|uniref:uncharacterized protein LOC130804265 isoform X2 n=1 Tax=Amaranthus tricolor TaxID=29722 RepID=UPI002590313E|nr:uncharacterized protein LOC130804265 isoform X2 [Amaranthus tricolor]
MAVTQEPILSRLDRLDNLMRHMEEMVRGSKRSTKSSSPTPSTPSSTASATDGVASSFDFSPRSACRPIVDVIVETEHKGTLLDRLALMEDRFLKLKGELEAQKADKQLHKSAPKNKSKGFKQFVKSCVKGK